VASLPERVSNTIAKRRLFAPRERILIAVSGGVDSMVLLHVLAELSRASDWRLSVAHLNHQLRGASSQADERLVRQTAKKLKLPIEVARVDVRHYATSHKVSIEMAARNLRHDFLARVSGRSGFLPVALAHHLDDQVELFFLRLFRGGGSSGLAGMKWRNPSPSNSKVMLVRPLLDCSKSELRAFALQWGIRFREDASNGSWDFQRNRIRHELLPLLQRSYQSGLANSIVRVMDILGAESEFLDLTANTWLETQIGAGGRRLEKSKRNCKRQKASDPKFLRKGVGVTAFEALPVAVQRRCVQLQLLDQKIAPDYDLVEHLRLWPGRPIDVSRTKTQTTHEVLPKMTEVSLGISVLRVIRDAAGTVRQVPLPSQNFREESVRLDLQGEGTKLDWEGVRFSWRIQAAKAWRKPGLVIGVELFDADLVGPTVFLRHWRPGDRFQPIGMERALKLQDFFVNQKVPRERRRELAIGTTSFGEIFWIEGLRISERFKLTKGTIRSLHWNWRRL
jgi:tRNA(Ile)-lysidine synthase